MIKKIKIKEYNLLKDLELDFTKPDGGIYNTIILAGENGTGKTSILDALAEYLNRQSLLPFEWIEYCVNEKCFNIVPQKNDGKYGYHIRKDMNTGDVSYINSGLHNNEEQIIKDVLDLRHYGFAYSRARSGFKTEQVKSVTTEQIDDGKYEPDNQESFTRIKQLLIDIDGQDASDWKKYSEAGGLNDVKYKEFKKQSKGYRFEKAFNDFFVGIKYKGIDNDDPKEKIVQFEKYSQIIAVDQLSTGEKQIVFRGAHLLKNSKNIAGGIVLIDEPELSMHPLWQKKILNYYRGLFTSGGIQTVQMIIATHSEYVIQSALKDQDDVLVIILTDEDGEIKNKRVTAPRALPTITSAETNYLAFGVPSTDYHIELYGFLQTKTGNEHIKDCDRFIASQPKYDKSKHEKIDFYKNQHYQTLPTYIRNAIDHPDSGREYSEEELKESIDLLVELCK